VLCIHLNRLLPSSILLQAKHLRTLPWCHSLPHSTQNLSAQPGHSMHPFPTSSSVIIPGIGFHTMYITLFFISMIQLRMRAKKPIIQLTTARQRDHPGPFRTIQDHRGPSRTAKVEQGRSRTIKDDRGQSRIIKDDRGQSRIIEDERRARERKRASDRVSCNR
jgi:hypothetical protein